MPLDTGGDRGRLGVVLEGFSVGAELELTSNGDEDGLEFAEDRSALTSWTAELLLTSALKAVGASSTSCSSETPFPNPPDRFSKEEPLEELRRMSMPPVPTWDPRLADLSPVSGIAMLLRRLGTVCEGPILYIVSLNSPEST